ncbi:MAG: TonB-dependent receptor [Halioglobus sp.]|nr:TonB-dependent receptor [Halioglobus sp.]
MIYFLKSMSKLGIVVALCALFSPMTLADGMLEEVVVTAQKRSQNLQDVPVAVSAFTGEQLREAGVRDMFELASIAPSLRVTQSQSSSNTSFGIRGIFTSTQNFGLESSVGLYVDGIYRARQGSMINNMIDIASVEVLRGPQGTLFGRNTPAGAVLLETVAPDFEGSGFINAGAGNYDLLDISGAKSFTLIDDVLAVRVTGFNMDRDGYVDLIGQEIQENDSLNDRDRWGLRFQALYTPNDDLTFRFIADHSEVDEACCAVGNWETNFETQNPAPPNAIIGSDTVVRDNLGGTVLSGNDFYDYKVSASFKPESQNTDEGISLQADWQTENFLLTSISGYRKHDAYDKGDVDFYDVDALIRTNDLKQEQYSQEFQISGDAFDDKLNYVGGLYYWNQTLKSEANTILGEDSYVLGGFFIAPLAPVPAIPQSFLPPGSYSRNNADQKHTSYAVFGQADYNITDQLVLTAGLRWTKEKKEMTELFTGTLPTPPGFAGLTELSPRPDVDENFDEDKVTWTGKISWFMNDVTMFYASYGTGYKSGGINTDRIPLTADTVFDPETAESYELGLKTEFPDQGLRVNVALHKTDTEDLQTISFQGAGFVLDNAGTAETYGGEVDVLWLPADNTTLTLAYAYNHAEYADFPNGACWTGTPWQVGPRNAAGVPVPPNESAPGSGVCDISGGAVSGNPENVVALTANQRFRLSDNLEGFAYGEYIWTDERMTDVNNDPEKLDGSYEVVNLRAGIVFENYQTTLTVWGRNVFDSESTSTIADAPVQTGRFIAYYKEPATWGASVRWDF